MADVLDQDEFQAIQGNDPATASDYKDVTVTEVTDGAGDDRVGLDVNANYKGPVSVSITDDSGLDAFGRLRVAENSILFDSYFVENDKSLLFSKKEVGGGTVTRNATTSNMELAVGTADLDRAVYQSKEYIHYIPGQSFGFLGTGKFATGKANLVQRVGLFDDDNGLFFEYDGTTFYVVVRSNTSGSVVDTRVAQTAWNRDKLDGSGDSGITLDLTKAQIWSIDYQWLGTGRVRFGFSIDGMTTIGHEVLNANNVTLPYTATGSLPVRYEILNDGATGSASTFNMTCVSVTSEGKFDAAVGVHAVDTGTSTVSIVTGSIRPVLALRLKSAFVRGTIVPGLISFLATSNDDILVRVYLNPTISGGTWNSAGAESIGEYNSTLNTTISGGEILESFYVAKSGGIPVSLDTAFLKVVADIDGNRDEIVIAAQSLTSSASVAAAINFKEFY